MKRSQSSKHTSLRLAASSPVVYSARENLISASSNSNSNAQWETFTVPTGETVSHHRRNKLLDLAVLRESDLDNLRKTDPFMYYSIPHSKSNARPDLTLTRPKPKNIKGEAQPHSDDIRRNSSDSVLMVKRRSRISFEKHYDMEEMLEEMKKIQASRNNGREGRQLSQVLDDSDSDDDGEDCVYLFLKSSIDNPAD